MATVEEEELKSLSFESISTAVPLKTPIINEDSFYNQRKDTIDHDHKTNSHHNPFTEDNPNQIIIQMKTNLGDSQKSFHIEQLKQLTYFENQLSGRWNNDNILEMKSDDLNCSIQELSEILHCKINDELSPQYPYERLPFLCSALDYLTEEISVNIYYKYLKSTIPCIKPQQLITLKKTCTNLNKISADVLIKAIDFYMTQEIEITSTSFNDKGFFFVFVYFCFCVNPKICDVIKK